MYGSNGYMEKLKVFVEKYQIYLFFFFSILIGYWPWILLGKAQWFIYGMPMTGLAITAITKGKEGIIKQLRAAINIRAEKKYYLGILLVLTTINFLTLLFAYILYSDVPSLLMIRTQPHLLSVFLLVVLLGGPILEEIFGLRGYALPYLLKTKSPLLSSIIVGTFFGAWHLIEFFRPGSSQFAIGLQFYPLFILTEIGLSVMMTWFYIKSGKNLFLGGIFFHWMMNSISVLLQTDISWGEMNHAPMMNSHYFLLYTLFVSVFALGFVIKGKMYVKEGNRDAHMGCGKNRNKS